VSLRKNTRSKSEEMKRKKGTVGKTEEEGSQKKDKKNLRKITRSAIVRSNSKVVKEGNLRQEREFYLKDLVRIGERVCGKNGTIKQESFGYVKKYSDAKRQQRQRASTLGKKSSAK